ncbi:hypothetical protein [Pedobacter arcticus]|uniref:hypothetical protein n=1 Tax=Pedobacter arcticus TaxID=752140 RepID=UPI00037C7F15|nr:hypothetical protein [Pedobacter arcticus]
MKKLILIPTIILMMFSVLTVSCDKKDDSAPKEEEGTNPKEKSKFTTFKFASTKKDCGITDGYANQQHVLPELIHLGTDKCNGETYRPTITLTFGEKPIPGTYRLVAEKPSAKEFIIESVQYNYTSWDGTAGTVVVTVNAEDATKVDIELKSITMKNRTANDPKNPATDTLTGFIIKI